MPCSFASRNIFLKPVPALLASIPASVNEPNKAVVSSTVNPIADAAGATLDIAELNLSISNDELLNDLAITSTNLWVSVTSNPKPLKVEPTIDAAFAKSVPAAAANCNVASVTPSISFCVKPNLANSNCSSETSAAVNFVVAPNSFAISVNPLISSRVTPKTEAKFACA